jgi:hypothetical protein
VSRRGSRLARAEDLRGRRGASSDRHGAKAEEGSPGREERSFRRQIMPGHTGNIDRKPQRNVPKNNILPAAAHCFKDRATGRTSPGQEAAGALQPRPVAAHPAGRPGALAPPGRR